MIPTPPAPRAAVPRAALRAAAVASLLLLIAACADTPPPAGTPFTLSPNPIGLRAIGQTLAPTATTTISTFCHTW